MDAGFLDMFHDTRNEDALAVAERVDIDLDRIGQVAVEQQRVLAEQGIDLAGLVVRITLLDILGHQLRHGVEQIGLQHALVVDDLHGDDLMSAAKDAGVDIEKAKAAAAAKWATDQAKEREAVAKKVAVDPDEQFKYQTLKDLYSQQVERANKALADYDKTPAANEAAITAAMNAVGAAESKPRYMPDPSLGKANPKDPMGRSKTLADKAAKGDPARAKLVAARDEAMKALNGLKEPELKTFESGAPMPKFEWNEDNIRDAIRGKIGEQPTPEQTAALTKYAKDNGVQTAQDLAKLPSRNDALAVAWVIANNARGATPDRKVELFNTLANYARTGDSKKSPIDANVAITGARVAVAGGVARS